MKSNFFVNSKHHGIVLIGPFPPIRGGISLFNSELRKAFELYGYKVLPISFKRQYPGVFFPGTSELMPESQSGNENTQSENAMAGKLDSIRVLDTCNPLTWFKAVKIIVKSGIDTVVISWWHSWFIPCFSVMADRLTSSGIKVCFLCHNFRHHGASAGLWDFFIKRMLFKSSNIIFLSGFVASIAEESFSKSLSDSFSKFFSRTGINVCEDIVPHCSTLFHPVYNTEVIKPVKISKQWKGRILMAGYIRSYKGIEYGLDLLLKDKGIVLTIAGEFYDKKLLKSTMKKKEKFGSRLRIIPEYLTDLNLVSIIDDHDMLICPYTQASQSGIVALAQGRATPVAVFPAGGLAEQISENTGIVCENFSVTSLKRAIDEIYMKTPLKWAESIKKEQKQKSWTRFLEEIKFI